MQAWYEHCDSIHLLHNSVAALLVMLFLNLFAFLFFGIGMGYTWSLFLCLQFITMTPFMYMYIPTCLLHYHKNVELVNGYDHLIRDNFLAWTYYHYDLASLKPWNWRYEHYGYPYSSLLDGCADIWQCWLYMFWACSFMMMITECFWKSKYESHFESIAKDYKW